MVVFILANYGTEIMHAHSICACVCSAGWDYNRVPYNGRNGRKRVGRPEKRQGYPEIILNVTLPGKPRIP